MERVRLWRNKRRKLIGVVELDESNRRLIFHIDDEEELDRVTDAFKQTGEVTWAWTGYGDELQELRAEPRTDQWFWFVVANILYPLGYQADFGVDE
ncbi:MAG: hypothetical protein ACR2I4_04905 [Actinomycetota bacterium]